MSLLAVNPMVILPELFSMNVLYTFATLCLKNVAFLCVVFMRSTML